LDCYAVLVLVHGWNDDALIPVQSQFRGSQWMEEERGHNTYDSALSRLPELQ
jgi:hypothetical protein